jgi:hypothetical protein
MKVTIGACDDSTCEVEGKHVHYKDEVHMIADNVDAAEFTQYEGEGIRKMVSVPPAEIPKRDMFDVCKELNRLSFQSSRRDDALFYIRPDMCIRQRDFDSIRGEHGQAYGGRYSGETDIRSLRDEIIYIPTEADLFHALESDLEQLTHTNSAGWFAYTNIRLDDGTIRGQGENPWFALADAWIKVQEWKLKDYEGDKTISGVKVFSDGSKKDI